MNKTTNKNLLMILGVVEIEEDILALGSDKLEYNRKPEYANILKEVFSNLQYLFQTKQPVFLVSSSGTGVMEGAATNVLAQGSSALVVNGGVFGERWKQICETHKINVIEINKKFGESVDPEDIRRKLNENPKIEAVFITQNETSTGTLTDLKKIATIVKNYENTILIVDCISSLLVEPMEMDKWGVDVVVGSGNKALALPPGIGFMSFSEKALKKAALSDNRLLNFDVFEYKKEWERNSTPYTPPITLVHQLKRRLEKIKEEGLENIRKRFFENTEYLRNGVKKLGLSFFSKAPANCVTGVVVPSSIDAGEVVKIMREKHKIDIAPSWPELRKVMFRVGNFGNINKPEIDRFLSALELSLKELSQK